MNLILNLFRPKCAQITLGHCDWLGLLDHSATFDCVDHQILCDRSNHKFGFTGLAFQWFRSYFEDRSQFVFSMVKNLRQSWSTTVCRKGPSSDICISYCIRLIYSTLWTCSHGLEVHGYADDLQICGHCDTGQTGHLTSTFSNCVNEVKNWISSNRLCLNPDKTKLIWLASSRRLDQCPEGPLLVSGAHVKPSMKVRDLGVYIDFDLSLSSHICQVTSTCFYNIRQLRLVRRSLTEETSAALVRSFIHSRLDYSSAVLAGQPDYVYKRLQSVLRSAARLVL